MGKLSHVKLSKIIQMSVHFGRGVSSDFVKETEFYFGTWKSIVGDGWLEVD